MKIAKVTIKASMYGLRDTFAIVDNKQEYTFCVTDEIPLVSYKVHAIFKFLFDNKK